MPSADSAPGPTAPWTLGRGAYVAPDGSVRFAIWAPQCERLAVRIWQGEGARDVPLAADDGGVFATTVEGLGAGVDYAFLVAGHERPDPVSRAQPGGVHGPSRTVDPAAYAWGDARWRGREMADLVLYEVHVGTFTEAGTFEAMIPHLGALRELGITAVELMPVAEFPGGRNWGYDGVGLYAPQSTYGGPEGLRRLVDAAHQADLAVVLDVVYNHLGPEGNYLGELGPYFTDFYRTPWGSALNFDGAESDEVRRYFVDNARYWISEFHVDALRLDAVHAICDFGARHLLEEIAEAVSQVAAPTGRRALVIAESDLNDPRLLRPPTRGGYGLDGQWSDDFHHAVHAQLTGERRGYYADFGGVAPLAKALRDRFVYDGCRSGHRRRRHGAPATDVPADRFVVCVQNHDQIGNRARGDRLATLLPVPAQRLAATLLLVSPYVPLLFMGEEYGETSPFPYFVSHTDPALVEAVRAGRRREFAAFGWEDDVPDPQAEATFRAARLDRARAAEPRHAGLRALHADLLRLRRDEPALRPGSATVAVEHGDEAGWLQLRLDAPGAASILALFNTTGEPRAVPLGTLGAGRWGLRLATDDPRYGGDGTAVPAALADGAREVGLPPWGAVVYAGEGGPPEAREVHT